MNKQMTLAGSVWLPPHPDAARPPFPTRGEGKKGAARHFFSPLPTVGAGGTVWRRVRGSDGSRSRNLAITRTP
jgi:hypothetical protein